MSQFVQLLLMTQATTPPDAPSDVSLSTYSGSLVQVNWTNAHGGAKQTRVYRRTSPHAGSWTLIATKAETVAFHRTGDSAASNYTYGVATYDPTTGLESAVETAVDLPPDAPTGVTEYTYGSGLTKIGINWTNTESLPVRCYRNGVLITTQVAGTTSWDSGFTSGTLGVSHYDSSSGLESSIAGPGA